MAKKKAAPSEAESGLTDIRHTSVKRKNIPPAKIAAEGVVPLMGKVEYDYSPRRPPVLRFDTDGGADKLPELLAEATRRPLKPEEARLLAEALRTQEPWLEWAGKRESQAAGFTVDPVALLIHERISAQAILRIAARQDVQRDLFSDPQQEYREAVQFYRHDIDWTNRLILGDSLQAMASLARREDLAGKVQMIYMDPPYGIKYPSNFQPEVGKRDVKDKESDLTREPEMVRAYRDTWHIGVHSYLSYLRDRLVVAKELLSDTGSIFVQISDENLHRVRMLLDEVFGSFNCISVITFQKTGGAGSPSVETQTLASVSDYLLWYSKDVEQVKYRTVFNEKPLNYEEATGYQWIQLATGEQRTLSSFEKSDMTAASSNGLIFKPDNLTSQSGVEKTKYPISFSGRTFRPPTGVWKTGEMGMNRLLAAERITLTGDTLKYVRRFQDFPARPMVNLWKDTVVAGVISPFQNANRGFSSQKASPPRS
jgi:adenine-specific DNA-methyltransferase